MLTGNRNLDFKILNELDDKDLVNVCQTNHHANELCNNETFWLNRIRIKFPYLSLDILNKYKGNKSWSQYYIKDLRRINPSNAQNKLFLGADSGRLDKIIIAVNNGADIRMYRGAAVKTASENGHLEVVKYLKGLGVDIRVLNDYAFRYASYNGHLDVVKYLVENGANVRAANDFAVKTASQKGYLDVVKYLVSQGAPDPRRN